MIAARARCLVVLSLGLATLASTLPVVASPAVASPAVALPAAAAAPGASGAGDPYFPLYGNGGFDVRSYALDIRYQPSSRILTGRAEIAATATQDLSRFNLDLVGLTVRSVQVDGQAAGFTRSSGHELVVTPARSLAKGAAFQVVVSYDGRPQKVQDPELGTYGFLETGDGALASGEPEVAAFWYPVSDHPTDKATYRIKVTVPKGLQSISNGLPSATTTTGDWSTTTWTSKRPMASYLALLAVGRFEVRRWQTSSGLPVIDAVDPALTSTRRARINRSLQRQSEILAAETGWFGPYPFEAAGAVVDDVDLGFALENQTRPMYAPDFWSDPDDNSIPDVTVVHELAHQWYGDSVSLRRWQDIWLNEGFATYAEWLWRDRESGITPSRYFQQLWDDYSSDDPFWRTSPGRPGKNELFGESVYVRGALTLQALRNRVGDGDFFTILRDWAKAHRDGNGTTTQFIALAEKVSGRDLDDFFDDWLFTGSKPPSSSAQATQLSAEPKVSQARVEKEVRAWRAGLQRRLAMARR